MGTIVKPPPIESGTDCSACTPSLWASGETPKYMFAFFSGIQNCGVSPHNAPNGHVFIMEQNPLNFCEWIHTDDVWTVRFQPNPAGHDHSQLFLSDHHGFSFFVGEGPECAPEIMHFDNKQASCILAYAGGGGYATVDWSGLLNYVIEEFGIETKPKLMRENRYLDDSYVVAKLCSLYQRTNLKLKIEL